MASPVQVIGHTPMVLFGLCWHLGPNTCTAQKRPHCSTNPKKHNTNVKRDTQQSNCNTVIYDSLTHHNNISEGMMLELLTKKQWHESTAIMFQSQEQRDYLLITLWEAKVTPATRIDNVIHICVGINSAGEVTPCATQEYLDSCSIYLAIQE